MREAIIVVVRFSAAFAEVWQRLAEGLDAEVQVISSGYVRAVPRTAAVLLAAGNREREALEWLRGHEVPPNVPVLVVGSDPSRRTALQMVGSGAADYFALPDGVELLRNGLAAAVAQCRQSLAPWSPSSGEDQLAPFEAIVGEPGTGKETLARAIHQAGPRRGAPFVLLECSALPHELLESDLLGRTDAPPVNAQNPRPGLLEVAHGGTLFLDEIGKLPLDIQGRLLRMLEDHTTCRTGGARPRPADVRVIAGSTEKLEVAVARGAFRRDLYLALSAVTLVLPPLRKRGDVTVIAERLLNGSLRQPGKLLGLR